MMSSFEQNSTAGFSLTEVLVVLAILSLTLAVFATSRPGPSPAMQLQSKASDLVAAASAARITAIQSADLQTLELTGPFCDESAQTLTFFANGTATEAAVCLMSDNIEIRFLLDPLTGQLLLEDTS